MSLGSIFGALAQSASTFTPSPVGAPPREFSLAIHLPSDKDELSRWDLTQELVKRTFEQNHIPVSQAAIEEVTARMGTVDFNGERGGKFATLRNVATKPGQYIPGYEFKVTPEFQRSVLAHTAEAVQITEAGTPALKGASLSERMNRAIEVSRAKYMQAETAAAFAELGRPTNIAKMAGAAGVVAVARIPTGLVGAYVTMDQELKGMMEFDDFAKASAGAKSTEELDVAAQHFAKLAARLTINGALVGAGAATAKAVPLAANTMRNVGETARDAGASTVMNPTAVATAGEARIGLGKLPTESVPAPSAPTTNTGAGVSGAAASIAARESGIHSERPVWADDYLQRTQSTNPTNGGAASIPNHPQPITKETLEHVFHGHVRHNKASGFHSDRGGMQAVKETKIIEGTRTPNDANSVYEAKVTVGGVPKKFKSSFFPDTWTKAEVVQAVREAYVNRAPVVGRTNFFVGQSSSGVKIGMYLNPDATIATAYPLYGK